MEITISERELPSYFDGDWQVTWSFEDYFISTSVIANNAGQALRTAESRLPWLIKEEDCLELSIQLMGVYGGYAIEDIDLEFIEEQN